VTTTESGVRIDVRTRLEPSVVATALALLEAAADADGVLPLSEHAWLHLRHGGDAAAHNVLAWSGEDLAGYAHLDPTDRFEGRIMRPHFRVAPHGSPGRPTPAP
jgi:mycothiol synthase